MPGHIPYIELHCHSSFSLCDGASTPEELIARAVELQMPALALTDHDSVAGAVAFGSAAQAAGIQPIYGAELTLYDGSHLTLLVRDAHGWANLCELITQAQAQAPKGRAALPPAVLAEHTAGLIALSGCRQGYIAQALRAGDRAAAFRAAERLRELFGSQSVGIEVQQHLHPGDTRQLAELSALAAALKLPTVLTNNVHYARRNQRRIHDLLTCVRHHVSIDTAGALLRPNDEYYLKPGARLLPLLADQPAALSQSLRFAEQCNFHLQYGLQDLPTLPGQQGRSSAQELAARCSEALPQRYPNGVPEAARRMLAHELAVIERAGLANYLLIVADIVAWSRAQAIRIQGRGSAANSLVAYLLQIGPIDPLAHNLVFERFLSDERPALPDIDLDIAADRREAVIQYVLQRYGAAHAAMACTFVRFGKRGAQRDVRRVLGLDLHATNEQQAGLLDELSAAIAPLPRHLGMHNGGMVITGPALASRVPIEPAAMPGRQVTQWDKDALETAGLIKIDLLGLRMLAVLDAACAQLAALGQTPPALDTLNFADPAIYAMLARGDTIGVFQVESRAQAQILPRLQPRRFADLIVAISLIRPGPLQGGMVHPYLRRRVGEEAAQAPHPLLEPALAETLGVLLFQEQVLRVAHDLAGFSLGEGERLRRTLGKHPDPETVAALRTRFCDGAQARGVPHTTASTVFDSLLAFGGYAFPKSHAAAFAVIVYQSAHLKLYTPGALLAALLNQQPMGFWSPAVLVQDAQRHGVRVLPVDLHQSDLGAQLTPGGVRLGLSQVHGLGPAVGTRILTARASQAFRDLSDFCRRTRLPRNLVARLIRSGACDGWGIPRRTLRWTLHTLQYEADQLELPPEDGLDVDLPPLTRAERLASAHATLGFALDDHPLALVRPRLHAAGMLSSAELAGHHGQQVSVVGMLILAQAPPTARGHLFLTLDDEFGMLQVIVRPQLAAHIRPHLHSGKPLRITGIVEASRGVTNLLAQSVRSVGEL